MNDLRALAAELELWAVDPASPAARTAMHRYYAELGERFEDGFDPGPHTEADDATMRAPVGVFVVALHDGVPVAGGAVREYGGTAEIKRMWVDPAWRGAGLGRRLLRHLEDEAVRLGHRTVRLDTNDVLTGAVAMYERAGYRPIARYNDNRYATHFFGKDLTDPMS